MGVVNCRFRVGAGAGLLSMTTKEPNIHRITSGSPNGKILTQAPALCYGKDGSLWGKTDDEYSDTGWEAYILPTPPAP